MDDKEATRRNRRKFLSGAALGGVGAAALLPSLATSDAVASSSWGEEDINRLRRIQAEREEAEAWARTFFLAMDDLDADLWISHFDPQNRQQDVILGDFSDLFPVALPPFVNCAMTPISSLDIFVRAIMARVGRPGRFMKFIHAAGSAKYGVAVDLHAMAGSFFSVGVDLISFLTLRNGKIVRRADYYDCAELTPADIAFIHPNGQPRLNCAGFPLPGEVANAAPEMLSFTRALHRALSSGDATRVAQFFDEDALLIHPLLYRGTGGYGPWNRGIQVRGRKAIARFFRTVLPILPDGPDSSLVFVAGGASGGAYEWLSGGIYSQVGLARNGIQGCTSIDLHGDRIQRMSVKFDTIQMTPEQRTAVRRALARENLVV